ncbi:hypothetical protein TRICI_004916 [Trichomonascus ciferrii]|uniref:Pentatricopeptide repeat-containing protein-mitochondrial domain-containing protein n=1 Tax=Trichomonascus ciferrii TaxID=44093 RepID=A0A642V4G2_9ASCO|nr:hypothetical protein TRICI_004916 [Trichomonascus ciferrii]
MEEKRQLDESIKQIQAYTEALRKHMWQQKDKESQKKVARSEGLSELNTPLDESDVDKFAELVEKSEEENGARLSGRGLFEKQLSLPGPVLERIGDTNAVILMASEEPNWGTVIKALYDNPRQVRDMNVKDVDHLISMIPLSQRAELMPVVHEMMHESGVEPSKLTLDLTMAAYADRGMPVVVDSFMEELRARGFKPDDYTFGHVIKAYSKVRDLKACVRTLKQMQREGVEQPSKSVTTNLLQTCIMVGDFKQAEEIFSMMKYLSAETQPDRRVYNSMLLAAAKQHNVDRVLDLYREMTTRPIDPLEPDMETLLTLIYACARDKKTHLQAWQYVLELQERKFPVTRKLINTLLYLCGTTGELSFARALFRQLCLHESSYPDSYAINCLFKAYVNYKPGFFSPVLTTALGNQIRSTFLMSTSVTDEAYDPHKMPPFLSIPMLRNTQQAIWESRAIFAFFKENHPHLLNEKITLNYLAVPAHLADLNEFKARYEEQTYFEDSATNTVTAKSMPGVMSRNHYVYDLAIRACANVSSTDPQNTLEFASQMWANRGKWRKTPNFTSMSKQDRFQSDFLFARGMITTLANAGEINDAIDLLKSSIKQFGWKHHHIQPLINKLIQLDDTASLSTIRRLIKQKWSQHEESTREFTTVQGDKDYNKLMKKSL